MLHYGKYFFSFRALLFSSRASRVPILLNSDSFFMSARTPVYIITSYAREVANEDRKKEERKISDIKREKYAFHCADVRCDGNGGAAAADASMFICAFNQYEFGLLISFRDTKQMRIDASRRRMRCVPVCLFCAPVPLLPTQPATTNSQLSQYKK